MTKAAKARRRRRVLRAAAASLATRNPALRRAIDIELSGGSPGSGGYSVFQATAPQLRHVVGASWESRAAEAAHAELSHFHSAEIAAALCEASLSDGAPILADFEPAAVSTESLAHAAVANVVADNLRSFDPEGLRRVRRFPPRLRGAAAAHVLDHCGQVVPHRADMLDAVPVLLLDSELLDNAPANARLRDVLNAAGLPRAARRILPASLGPIHRYGLSTFKRWTANPAIFGELSTKTFEQRRQVELVSLLVAILAGRGARDGVLHDAIVWVLASASVIPAGRHGRHYRALVDLIVATVAPAGALVAPPRPWHRRMGAPEAVAAANTFAELVERAARSVGVVRTPSPDMIFDTTAAAPTGWPANAEIAGLSFVHLSTLLQITFVGGALQNCLANGGGPYRDAILNGDAAVYALAEGDVLTGAVALHRDCSGRPAISEARGVANKPLSTRIVTIVNKWVSA